MQVTNKRDSNKCDDVGNDVSEARAAEQQSFTESRGLLLMEVMNREPRDTSRLSPRIPACPQQGRPCWQSTAEYADRRVSLGCQPFHIHVTTAPRRGSRITDFHAAGLT